MKPLLFALILAAAIPAAYPSSGPGEPLLFYHDPAVHHFRMRSGALSATFEPTGIVFRKQTAELHIGFVGANPDAVIEPRSAPDGRVNFITGRDPSAWRTGIPIYDGVVYRRLYPGIDMVYKSSPNHLKSEFLVAAGADPSLIRLRYSDAGQVNLNPDGSLVWTSPEASFGEEAPEVFQNIGDQTIPVPAAFQILRDGTIGFRLGPYDRGQPLVIDPAFAFSTYLGGSGMEAATGIATDSQGYIYITGWTDSSNLPAVSATQPSEAGNVDAFIAKWAPGGSSLIYCTYLGGAGEDRGYAIAAGLNGDAYITGLTGSSNFPTVTPLQSTLAGYRNAFLAHFDPLGNLIFSTYMGGNGSDTGQGIAVDPSGNVYVAGQTSSYNFPVLNAYQNTIRGQADAFVAKLYASGALAYSTYIGGSGTDIAQAIAVDSTGNAYITGSTTSSDYPLSNAMPSTGGRGQTVFVTKLDSTGRFLLYSTYLGGCGANGAPEIGYGIAVDQADEAIVAGVTSSSTFPVVAASQPGPAGGQTDAFVAKFAATGSGLIYSTYLGGSSLDYATSVAVDLAGNAYVGGYTASTDFPRLNAAQSAQAGSYDGFVAEFSPTGSLLGSTFLGGGGSDTINAIAVLHPNMVFVAGQTQSYNLPIANATYSALAGSIDAFTAILASVPRDFDRNGKPDLILQNGATNQVSIWFMGGPLGSVLLSAPIILTPAPGWHVVASNDFNGDGIPDLILQNTSTNQLSIWSMGGIQGTTLMSSPIFAKAASNWNVIAAADFDGDGYTDLLLRNAQTNQLSVWFMNGTTMQAAPVVGSLPSGWTVAAVADFDGDGSPDLVIENQQTNEIQIWYTTYTRSGMTVKSTYSLGDAAPGWYVTGAGDFDSNGCPDLILENDNTNRISFWYMAGEQCTTRVNAPIIYTKVGGWMVTGTR